MRINERNEMLKAYAILRNEATDEIALRATAAYPNWKEGKEYQLNQRIRYNDILYKTLITHTSQADWTPDVSPSIFAKVLIPNENEIPEWEQPDSTNAYSKDDKVMCEGKTWISIIDNNVWKPGEYGWNEI